MFNRCKLRPRSRFGLAAAVAVAGLLFATQSASAQYYPYYYIPPDQSFVYIGRQPPMPVNWNFTVGPVYASPGRNWVTFGGTFSGSISNPGAGPGFSSFMMPTTANDRIAGSFIYGGKNPPRPMVVNPYQVWW